MEPTASSKAITPMLHIYAFALSSDLLKSSSSITSGAIYNGMDEIDVYLKLIWYFPNPIGLNLTTLPFTRKFLGVIYTE